MKQLPDKFSVYAKTLEEAEYITQKQKELCKSNNILSALENHYYRFSPLDMDKRGYSSSSYLTNRNLIRDYNIQHEFTCDEFKSFFEQEYILPEKWAVLRTMENYDVLNNWANSQPGADGHSEDYGYIHSIDYGFYGWDKKSHHLGSKIKHPGHTEITFKNFKKYVLKQTNTMKEENKKIIGYRLIKPEYREAALKIVPTSEYLLTGIGGISGKNYLEIGRGTTITDLQKAGVLELWFEPVFEEIFTYSVGDYLYCIKDFFMLGGKKQQYTKDKIYLSENDQCITDDSEDKYHRMSNILTKEYFRKATLEEIEKFNTKTISMNGKFNLVVKNKKVFHNGEDITNYVLEVGEQYSTGSNLKGKFAGYDLHIKDMVLSKTGCESKETFLSQWLKVYNLIK